MPTQTSFFKKTSAKYRYRHGGILRQERAGRGARPLSGKNSLHLVFKANQERVKSGFRISRRFALIHFLIRKYALKFHVKISHLSIQGNHIHLHIRTTRRSNYQSFFRVVAGQIAQRFEKEGLLTLRPKVTDTPNAPANPRKAKAVTDTPAGATGGGGDGGKAVKRLWKHRPFTRVVMGEIPYRKERLRGLSDEEWELLWN